MIDLLDLHTHTIASGHAYNTLYEMAQAAADKGLSLYGWSEHAPPLPGSCGSVTSKCFPESYGESRC